MLQLSFCYPFAYHTAMTAAEFAELSAASWARPRMPGSTREKILAEIEGMAEAMRLNIAE